ncbi:hypothetical protein SKAU_G00195370 [Synaphobranchus kaupii]|uniref:Uncharacterized protein n=1 Tax=Synaphobranchus kaupii TaxID=118154 RepID=A0A9Q1FEU2_SYNKA|nr:hypothetical protein SKAU_G00195370 [Synaphobranchus kaupii]
MAVFAATCSRPSEGHRCGEARTGDLAFHRTSAKGPPPHAALYSLLKGDSRETASPSRSLPLIRSGREVLAWAQGGEKNDLPVRPMRRKAGQLP